jgi:hypothetical protein
MSTNVDDGLVTDIARIMIAEAAPAELPIFGALSKAYFADSKRASAGGGDRGLLKIGDTGFVLLLTPVALAAATEVTQYLFGEVIRPAVARGGAAVRQLFGAEDSAEDPSVEPAEARVELTAEQWAEVRQVVVEVVHRCGLTDDVAQVMADAVVGAGHRPDETP